MGIVWRDGKFIGENEFRISPYDRGLCHGLSLFETLLSVNGQPRLLREHLMRMRGGLERLGVKRVELDEVGLGKAMVSLLEQNGLQKGMARLRLTISLGAGPLNHIDSDSAWAWMTAARVEDLPETVRITSAPWRRDRENVLSGIKVGNYAEHLIAMDMARREGFGEMLFFNNDDELCEAAMANVFLIRSGKLFTPSLDSGCLAGIARRQVVMLATAHGIPCQERPLRRADVAKAEGMFLTSSVRGPVWVSSYEGKTYEQHALFDAIRRIWLEEMARPIP